MMFDVAGGMLIAAAICGLFAFGVFSLNELARHREHEWRARGLVRGAAWALIWLSIGAIGAAIWFVLI